MAAADIISILTIATAVSAGATSLAGLLMLNSLFKEKLKALFDDSKYFIFFFLTAGYAFYAFGEVLLSLVRIVFKTDPLLGMSDFYWVLGSVFQIIAFAGLAYSLHAFHRDRSKAMLMVVIGIALLAAVLFSVAGFGRETAGAGLFLVFYYPLSTALIVALSLSIPFFYHGLELLGMPLLLLFTANVIYLAADMSYSGAGITILSESLYTAAYSLSAVSFIALWKRVHGKQGLIMSYPVE